MAAILRFVVDIVVLLLVLIGLAGSAIKFFEPEGFLDDISEKLFQLPSVLLIPSMLGIAVLLWALTRWAEGKGSSRLADYMVYILAAAGIFMILKWT